MSAFDFYTALPVFDTFQEASISTLQAILPSDWYVLVSDVENSTQASQSGGYRDVNAAGAASIIAVFNALGTHNIPFSFGGDGAIICIPDVHKDLAVSVLTSLAYQIEQATDITLRIGAVPVSVIEERGARIRIGRYHLSSGHDVAVFSGGGIEVAEQLIKMEGSDFRIAASSEGVLNLNGLECRWKPIPGPFGKVLALIVKATTDSDELDCKQYQALLATMNDIYGVEQLETSLSEEDLEISTDQRFLRTEVRIKGYHWQRCRCLILKTLSYLGKCLMEYRINAFGVDWADYKVRLRKNTDHRKFVDGYQHLISGSDEQHEKLRAYLDTQSEAGSLVYGSHLTENLLITCLVFDYNNRHIHFADGTDGGFAVAAQNLKTKLQNDLPL